MKVTTVIVIDESLRIRGNVKKMSGGARRGPDEKGARPTRPNPIVFHNTEFVVLLPQAPPMVLHYRVHAAS